MSLNGYHANGDGGQGEVSSDPFIDPHHRRASYRMLERAINAAMDVPTKTMLAAAQTAIKDLRDGDGRIRARAREFLLKLQDSGVAAAIGIDKIERLDAGQTTENVRITIPEENKQAVHRLLERLESHHER